MLPLKSTHRFPKGTLLLSLFGIWLRKPGCYHLYRLIPGQLSSCYEWMPWLAKGSGAEESQGGESRTEKYSSEVLDDGSLGSSRAMSPSGCMLNTDTQGRHTNIQKTLQLCTCTQSHTVSEGDSVLACQRQWQRKTCRGCGEYKRACSSSLSSPVRPPPTPFVTLLAPLCLSFPSFSSLHPLALSVLWISLPFSAFPSLSPSSFPPPVFPDSCLPPFLDLSVWFLLNSIKTFKQCQYEWMCIELFFCNQKRPHPKLQTVFPPILLPHST